MFREDVHQLSSVSDIAALAPVMLPPKASASSQSGCEGNPFTGAGLHIVTAPTDEKLTRAVMEHVALIEANLSRSQGLSLTSIGLRGSSEAAWAAESEMAMQTAGPYAIRTVVGQFDAKWTPGRFLSVAERTVDSLYALDRVETASELRQALDLAMAGERIVLGMVAPSHSEGVAKVEGMLAASGLSADDVGIVMRAYVVLTPSVLV